MTAKSSGLRMCKVNMADGIFMRSSAGKPIRRDNTETHDRHTR